MVASDGVERNEFTRRCEVPGCAEPDARMNSDHGVCSMHWLEFVDDSESYQRLRARLRAWLAQQRPVEAPR